MPSDFSVSADARKIFTRTIDLVGEEGFARLQNARVVVVGLGGVGSHAVMALARTGVGYIRVIDVDDVTLSSLNRHAYAFREHVGMSKAMLTKQVVESLCPSLTVDAHQAFYHHDTADQLLAAPVDYVIDAIDSFTPKVALLERCVQQNLPVVSCMGASSRTDPTALRIADIFETTECPLARAVRRGLRRKGIYHGITAVFSVERARPPLPADASEDVLQRGRVRHRQPSLIAMPGIFGYAAANVVIKSLSELTRPK